MTTKYTYRNILLLTALTLFFAMSFITKAIVYAQTTTNVPCDTPTLIQAITDANTSPGDDILELTAGCTYTLTVVDNYTYGDNGLPSITSNITINGNGATITRDAAAPDFRIFHVSAGGDLTLNDVTISKGRFSGGGIRNEGTLTINNSIISGNNAEEIYNSNTYGGGIYNVGIATIDNSTISGNNNDLGIHYVAAWGGGIFNHGTMDISYSTVSDNYGYIGGGINNDRGMMNIGNSVISGNNAVSGGGIENYGTVNIDNSTISGNYSYVGGGILNATSPNYVDEGVANITNSTISSNNAEYIGGIANGGIVNIYNSTIYGNNANADNASWNNSGGIYNDTEENCTNFRCIVNISNSIVAGNTVGGGSLDTFGTINSLDYNLIEDTTGTIIIGPTIYSIFGEDPLLNPLTDNGGSTLTHSLQIISPARDAGGACGELTDQRGFARDVLCDIGAYEVTPSFFITENEFFNQLQVEIAANPDSQMEIVLVDFTPGAMNLMFRMNDGTLSEVVVTITDPHIGYVLIEVTSITVNGLPASQEQMTVIHHELPSLIVSSLDVLIVEKIGMLGPLSLEIDDTFIMILQ